jgi:hypothetical protein
MGAACTTLDISPEAERAITIHNTKHIYDASFETIWKTIAPHIHKCEKRMKIRRLLNSYLYTNPVKDHYLILRIDEYTWYFEIQTNRRISRELTEIVLKSRHVSHRPKN